MRARRVDAEVDHLVRALGIDGLSKSEVSRICAGLDTAVQAFRARQLSGENRYVWVDSTYHKVRVDGRVTSRRPISAATASGTCSVSTSTGLNGRDVVATLERLRSERGRPQLIYCDNGTEFVSAAMDV